MVFELKIITFCWFKSIMGILLFDILASPCTNGGGFILGYSKTQKHRNTKYIYPKLRNMCSKLRNNHENSKILRKKHQKSWKNNKIDENKIFTKYENNQKTRFIDFCFVTLKPCLSSQIMFPMNIIDRSCRDLFKNVLRMFFWIL